MAKEEIKNKKKVTKKTTSKKPTVKKASAKSNTKTIVKKEEVAKVENKEQKTHSKNEKIMFGVIIALILVIVFGASFLASNSKNTVYNESSDAETNTGDSTSSTAEEESASVKAEEQGELTNIGIDDYLSKLSGSEKSIIYIARPTCHYCQLQEPITKYLIWKHGITVNYLNTDDLSDDDHQKLLESDEYFKEGYGTPLTLIVQDGKIVAKMEGLNTIENFELFFTDNGIISE